MSVALLFLATVDELGSMIDPTTRTLAAGLRETLTTLNVIIQPILHAMWFMAMVISGAHLAGDQILPP